MGAALGGQGATLGAVQGGIGVMGAGQGMRSSALNNVAQLTGSPMQWAQMGGQMMGQAASTYGMAANTMNSGFQNSMQSWKAGQDQAQQKFNNIMSVASVAGGMMMAEGGAVPGGGAGAGSFDAIKKRWAEKRASSDPYIRTGKGSGKGGALNLMDRMDNGAQAASQFSAGASNVYADMPARQAQPDLSQMASEGGRMRARGAIPTRQSRDNIPAWLTEGEYVVPRDVVQALGINHFDKLVQKYHRENS
jgi:hypothetical protein